MEELESQLSDLKDKILIQEYKEHNAITKEEIKEYLTHTISQPSKVLINSLIQKIIVFDDNIEIYYNYTDKPISDMPTDFDEKPVNLNIKKQSEPQKGSDCYNMVEATGLAFQRLVRSQSRAV
ncbi:MAG: hypothetical protein NC037_06260 [Bacteroides sp.]|nr:hypothetical protein [Bacillota bacterium]MCM1394337.1 hypothetical protein [[Eubacterium] siraeum]MCM1456107.1 hypothetical protein [Bacteroides sp.]